MNGKHDKLNNMLRERYRAYLDGLSHEQLVEYFYHMNKKPLIDIIQDLDPVGKGDAAAKIIADLEKIKADQKVIDDARKKIDDNSQVGS